MDFKLFAKGTIEGLYTTSENSGFITKPNLSLDFTLNGIPGDRHAGHTRLSGSREKKHYQKGTEIHNNRQWSAVSIEELGEVAAKMNLDKLSPEWLGANILVSGIERFTKLPPLSMLKIGSQPEGPILAVWGENNPCQHPHRALEEALERTVSVPFPKAAIGKRGLVGWVEKPGQARSGDTFEVWIPA